MSQAKIACLKKYILGEWSNNGMFPDEVIVAEDIKLGDWGKTNVHCHRYDNPLTYQQDWVGFVNTHTNTEKKISYFNIHQVWRPFDRSARYSIVGINDKEFTAKLMNMGPAGTDPSQWITSMEHVFIDAFLKEHEPLEQINERLKVKRTVQNKWWGW